MFNGSMPALITPFKEGELDKAALKNLVEWHIAEGSHGLVPVGTTGESPTLSHEEHEKVIQIVVESAAGRIPIIAGAGSNSTREALRLVQSAQTAGADGALVVTPYYNKPTQGGLIAHYTRLHENSNIPIIIYNIPGRSVIDMSTDTMAELAKLPRIVGVKDATGDLARVPTTRLACGQNFIQLSGEDGTALGYNAQGGVGCISVTANVAPKLCSEFQNAMAVGDYELALTYQDKLSPLNCAIFLEPGLVGAKYALSLLGKCEPDVRMPLVEASDETKQAIETAIRLAGLIN